MSICRITGVQPFRLSPPPPPKKKSLIGCGRKLSDMSPLQDAQLPIPQCLLQVSEFFTAAWFTIASKIQDVWDYICVWIFSLASMYHFTEEQKSNLLEWVRSKAPGCSVSDFSNSWKNGIALVALVENLVPKACSCPQYHLLNPKHSIQNAELAFSMATKHLGIYPLLSAIDLASGGSPSSEKKLILYVTMLKMAATRKQTRLQKEQLQPNEVIEDPIFHNQPCLAKGMGLTLAVKNRQACFNIYLKQSDYMDIMIEIRGPSNDFVSRRITNRSPHHTLDVQWPGQVDKINTLNQNSTNAEGKLSQSKAQMNIILEYEIIGRKVSVSYIPQSAGQHHLSIFWKGYHVEGSPFHVRVDDCSNSSEDLSQKQLMPNACPIQKTFSSKNMEMQKAGRIIRRRILRKFIIQNGQEMEMTDDNDSADNEDLNWFQGNKKIKEIKPIRSHLMVRRKAVAQNPYANSPLMKQNNSDFNNQVPRINIEHMPTIAESQGAAESTGESEFWKNLHTPSRKSSHNNINDAEPLLDESACHFLTTSLNKHLNDISNKKNDKIEITRNKNLGLVEKHDGKKIHFLSTNTQKLFQSHISVADKIKNETADGENCKHFKQDLVSCNKVMHESFDQINFLEEQNSEYQKSLNGDAHIDKMNSSPNSDTSSKLSLEETNMQGKNWRIESFQGLLQPMISSKENTDKTTIANRVDLSCEETLEMKCERSSEKEIPFSSATKSIVKSKILQWENSLF